MASKKLLNSLKLNKMKILFVIPYYVPAYSYGGPIKVAHDLAKKFIKKGNSVTVATTDVHDAKSRNVIREEEINGVKIMRFRNLSNYLAKNFNAYLPFDFKKWIKENLRNYDIVHCHDFFTYQNIVISKYCKKFRIPYIVQPHGCLDKNRRKTKFTLLKFCFIKLFAPVLQNAKNIIALTQYEKESIQNLLSQKEKIETIPNGIYLNEFTNVQKINLRKKYNLSDNTKLLFYLGRIQHIKGIDYIIKTFSTLNKLNNKLKYNLFIIGPDEGGEKNRLLKLIKKLKLEKKTIFTGQLEGSEKNQFVKSCDLSLFFSKGEGLPMTALEVATLGIPSMLSKECRVPEIALGNGGYEVEKNDYENNAKLIEKHFEDEAKIETMKKNAQVVIKNKFELDVIVEKMLELYHRNN